MKPPSTYSLSLPRTLRAHTSTPFSNIASSVRLLARLDSTPLASPSLRGLCLRFFLSLLRSFLPGRKRECARHRGTKREKGGAKGEKRTGGWCWPGSAMELEEKTREKEREHGKHSSGGTEERSEVRWEPYVPPPVNWQYSCRAAYTASGGGLTRRRGWLGCTTDSHSPGPHPRKRSPRQFVRYFYAPAGMRIKPR